MKHYKIWLLLTAGVIALPLLLIGGVNFYIDPLWNFEHAHQFNRTQIAFDERQQKTNRIHFSLADYDTLILGSSRTTYMDHSALIGLQAYNYALSIMLMEEYYDYVEFAKRQVGHDFDNIVIGLDFFVTNENLVLQNEFQPPVHYIARTSEFAYRFKMLLSLDVLEWSKKNYQASQWGQPITFNYDRQGRKTLNRVTADESRRLIAANLDNYGQNIFANYEYRDVAGILGKLQAANPETQFIVFTTPTAEPLWELMVTSGLLPDYERWLQDCVAVFGQVYSFDYPNSVTHDLNNYYDASHLYPEVETLIAHRIINYPDPRIPDDFGVLVNKDNLRSHLDKIEALAR